MSEILQRGLARQMLAALPARVTSQASHETVTRAVADMRARIRRLDWVAKQEDDAAMELFTAAEKLWESAREKRRQSDELSEALELAESGMVAP